MQLLYLIALPGAGKTTVAKTVTAHLKKKRVEVPIKLEGVNRSKTLRLVYTQYGKHAIQLGHDERDWAGTDSLDKAIFPYVQEWIEWQIGIPGDIKYIFAEGDRFNGRRKGEHSEDDRSVGSLSCGLWGSAQRRILRRLHKWSEAHLGP